jgi:hypothetical protein
VGRTEEGAGGRRREDKRRSTPRERGRIDGGHDLDQVFAPDEGGVDGSLLADSASEDPAPGDRRGRLGRPALREVRLGEVAGNRVNGPIGLGQEDHCQDRRYRAHDLGRPHADALQESQRLAAFALPDDGEERRTHRGDRDQGHGQRPAVLADGLGDEARSVGRDPARPRARRQEQGSAGQGRGEEPDRGPQARTRTHGRGAGCGSSQPQAFAHLVGLPVALRSRGSVRPISNVRGAILRLPDRDLRRPSLPGARCFPRYRDRGAVP